MPYHFEQHLIAEVIIPKQYLIRSNLNRISKLKTGNIKTA